MKKPNPGSDKALEMGCTCPILDNRHGLGAYNYPDGMFYINTTCPIHGGGLDEKPRKD